MSLGICLHLYALVTKCLGTSRNPLHFVVFGFPDMKGICISYSFCGQSCFVSGTAWSNSQRFMASLFSDISRQSRTICPRSPRSARHGYDCSKTSSTLSTPAPRSLPDPIRTVAGRWWKISRCELILSDGWRGMPAPVGFWHCLSAAVSCCRSGAEP